MLLLLTAAFLLKRYGTQAVPLPAPTPPSSTYEAPIFARDVPSDGCNSRTVLDILWSCLATTFSCTWVSVHPNVPFRGEGKWPLLGRRVFLMFFSILAPEFMIVWAFKQWRGAVMIREVVNEASEKAFQDTKDSRRNSWTTTHGHLLQMGGFRLIATQRENLFYKGVGPVLRSLLVEDLNPWQPELGKVITIPSSQSEDLIPKRFHYRHETSEGVWSDNPTPDNEINDNLWEGVLTIDGLKKVLSENLITFPTVSEDEINDKSKGDALSKGIALLQITWFIVQIITRAVQGLAITELELTTVALAGLNSVMYIFWWSKPCDVRFPVVIRTKGVEELLAKRTEDSTWSFSDQKQFDFRIHLWTSMTTPITLCEFLVSSPTTIKKLLSDLAGAISVLPGYLYSFLSRSRRYFMRANEAKSGEQKRTGRKGSSYAPVVADPETDSEDENMSRKQQIYGDLMHSARIVVYCLLSLLGYAINFGLFIPISQIMDSDEDGVSLPMVFDATEQLRVLYMMFYSEDVKVQPLFSTASIAGALFGVVHCLAWHFSFPSLAEQIMWRTASLGIVGACALSIVGIYPMKFIAITDFDELDGILRKICYNFILILYFILMLLTAVVYPVFRLMLLVLAVTSLRSLPLSAFDTVQWIEFVPHI